MTIESSELNNARKALEHKRLEIKNITDQAGPQLDMAAVKGYASADDATADLQLKLKEAEPLNDRVKALASMVDSVNAVYSEDASAAVEGPARKASTLSVGARFAKGAASMARDAKVTFDDVDVKTLMSRTAGWAPESLREPGYLAAAVAPLAMVDIIPTSSTTMTNVKYMEQTTRTNGAVERAEGAVYGEAAIGLTEMSFPVQTIGVWIPATDEQLEDESEASALIDMDLPMMLRQRLDSQILNGSGVNPFILGLANKPGINVQAKGADATLDAIYKGMTLCSTVGRGVATAFAINPADWTPIRLLRTIDGIYILGNPDSDITPRLWGAPGIVTTNQVAGSVLTGDFAAYSRLQIKRGIVMERTNTHSSDFINGIQAIRASVRGVVTWRRPAAFTKVTGL
jgi:HK97 family phage major capsid protein